MDGQLGYYRRWLEKGALGRARGSTPHRACHPSWRRTMELGLQVIRSAEEREELQASAGELTEAGPQERQHHSTRGEHHTRAACPVGKQVPHEVPLLLSSHPSATPRLTCASSCRWSAIARSLPGRTDNEIKNCWRTHFKKVNTPRKKAERARTRLLVRQQQERQKQKQQQQEAEDMGPWMMMQVDEDAMPAEEVQEMAYVLQGGGFQGYVNDEDGSWGCLWNLDDDASEYTEGGSTSQVKDR
ncbi:MYB family transcription factor, partial [Musa troglodytarum]